jgi:hypothetical protein
VREVEFAGSSLDGVWAVASLLHIKRAEVAETLIRLRRWLRDGGLLLTSMMKGQGEEIGRDGREFVLYQPDEWGALLEAAGFSVEGHDEMIARNQTGGRAMDEIAWFVTIARAAGIQ